MNILKTIFLSSSGNGNISTMWKGILVVIILSLFPDSGQDNAMALADKILVVSSGAYALYGAIMKLYRGRWSQLPE